MLVRGVLLVELDDIELDAAGTELEVLVSLLVDELLDVAVFELGVTRSMLSSRARLALLAVRLGASVVDLFLPAP